jgi:hypothetical protein
MDRAVVAGAVAKPGTPRVDQSRTPGRPKSHSGRSRRARVTRASCVGHEPSSVSGSFRGLTGFVLGARRPWRCPRRRGHATAARYRRPLVLVVFRRASLGLAGLVAVLAWTPAALACGAERWPEKTLQDRRASRVKFTPVGSTVDALPASARRSRPRGLSQSGRCDNRLPRPARRSPDRRRRGHPSRDRLPAQSSPYDERRVPVERLHRSSLIDREAQDALCSGELHPRAAARQEVASDRSTAEPRSTAWGSSTSTTGRRGVAPNAIELHPVKGFRASSC